MLIREFAGAEAQAPRLMALAQFLSQRARDEAVDPRISRDAFIEIAANMGIAITPAQLKDMIQRPPLNGVIADVTGDDDQTDVSSEVIFQGADQSSTDQGDPEMTPDMARQTVDSMAKRATGKAIKGLG
jgi:hypothetical protein